MRAAAPRPLQFVRWVHSYEWISAGAILATGSALALLDLDLPVDLDSVGSTAGYMATSLPAAALLGVLLRCLHQHAAGGEIRTYLQRVRRPAWWAGWLRRWLAYWVSSFAYF